MVKMRARAVKMTREMHETTTWIMCGGVKQSACRGSGAQQQGGQSMRPAESVHMHSIHRASDQYSSATSKYWSVNID